MSGKIDAEVKRSVDAESRAWILRRGVDVDPGTPSHTGFRGQAWHCQYRGFSRDRCGTGFHEKRSSIPVTTTGGKTRHTGSTALGELESIWRVFRHGVASETS